MDVDLFHNSNFPESLNRRLLLALLCLGATWVLQGTGYAQTGSSQSPNPASIKRILLLPAYDMCRIFGENISLTGPLSGNVFVTAKVETEAADHIYARIKRALTDIQSIRIITADGGVGTSMVGVAPVTGHPTERIAAIQNLGRQNEAEGVFCTYIYAFRERIGTAYGVDQPAMVSFEVNMVNVATGRVVWQSHFTETQKTLSDNILLIGRFLKRKGRWVTAEEMANGAVKDLMNAFESEFLNTPR